MRPPAPGLVATAGPPRRLRALRMFARATPDLAAALAHLAPVVQRPGLRRALLQVRYTPDALTADRAAAHQAFLRRFPHVSGWLPFCLPGTPQHATLGPLATPHDCRGCLFYEGRACQGLGDEAAAFGDPAAGLALQPVDRPLAAYGPADFAAPVPIAYWRPTDGQIATLAAAVRAAGGRLWDVGGGNGYLGARLAAAGVAVRVIDPAPYVGPPGVERVRDDVRRVADAAPDALLLSWPPTGDGFADVIARLRPKVLITAGDVDGFCGCHPEHAAVVATPEGLAWFGWPRPDRYPGYRVARRWRVRSHQDLRHPGTPWQGRLVLRIAGDA
ncbi:MAG: hypothetical protein H6706_08960 [Myxococcales bacterium]|nr:hypothetical protein [Myxococcales bacterium]